MHKFILVLGLVIFSWIAVAEESPIFKASVDAPVDQVHKAVYTALEEARMWVVFEANIGDSIKGMAGRFGDEYNQNGLEAIRSMVVCNAWYANKVSNTDPDLLALCPLRVSVIHKQGVSSVLFVRPSIAAVNSPGLPLIKEIEQSIINAITDALTSVK